MPVAEEPSNMCALCLWPCARFSHLGHVRMPAAARAVRTVETESHAHTRTPLASFLACFLNF